MRHANDNGKQRRPRPSYEAEVLPGLAEFAQEELREAGIHDAAVVGAAERADAVRFSHAGEATPFLRLRLVTSVQRSERFAVPRPKALLGDAHFPRLAATLRAVRATAPEPFHGLRLEAAGSDSPTMLRLRRAAAEAVGLPDDPVDGDLRWRLRRDPAGSGWEAAVRLTPRPLSARPWRVRNLPGGLNACVAAALWRMAGQEPDQRVFAAMCGSGTLLIERATAAPARALVGMDLEPEALAAAEANVAAAALARRTELVLGDATRTPYPDGSFDVVACDPPWGDAVGAAALLPDTYRALLQEAARLLPPGGRLAVVTHALAVWREALTASGDAFRPLASLRVLQGGHRPLLQVLERRSDLGSR